MDNDNQRIIRSLTPLPGGQGKYLSTIHGWLKWLGDQKLATREGFLERVIREHQVKSSSAAQYLQVIHRLQLVAVQRSGQIDVSERGKVFLNKRGDSQALMLIDDLFRRYLGFVDALHFFADIDRPAHLDEVSQSLQSRFPQWTSAVPLYERVRWWIALRCLRPTGGRTAEITEFGKFILLTRDTAPSSLLMPQPAATTHPYAEADVVIATLQQTVHATDAPEKFEQAVARAFEFLGFQTTLLGEPGNTDVLACALCGETSYSLVVDAKARASGQVNYLDTYALSTHRKSNQADYAVVVATSFSKAKTASIAIADRIVLLPLDVLIELIQFHEGNPLNIRHYECMFQIPGIVEKITIELAELAAARSRQVSLVRDTLDVFHGMYNRRVFWSLSAEQVFATVAYHIAQEKYTGNEIVTTLEFLSHPLLQCALTPDNGRFSMGMNNHTLAQTLVQIARELDI